MPKETTSPPRNPKRGALVIAAVAGMILGCAHGPDASGSSVIVPSSAEAPLPTAKDCCRAKNACKGLSGCLTETNALGAGKNTCRAKGTSCPKPA